MLEISISGFDCFGFVPVSLGFGAGWDLEF
jgi:hypothetical protein